MNYHADFYVNRLVTEWLEHEKLIVACDIDDTLIPYNKCRAESCSEVIKLLLECQKEGLILILNTARGFQRHAQSKRDIEKWGLNVHEVNKTPAHLDLPYGHSGKVYANIFLDDRSGLSLAVWQLGRALQEVKQIREQQRLKEEI